MTYPSGVLVTGATGFIGRRLVNRLLAEGRSVRVLARKKSSGPSLASVFDAPVEVVHGNINDRDQVLTACRGMQTVFHLAAATSGPWSDHQEATVTGTAHLLGAAVEARVPHVIYTSSFGVYAAAQFRNGVVVDEDFPLEPHPERRGSYSRAKRDAEELALEHLRAPAAGTAVTILRPGLVWGPGKLFFPDLGVRFGSRGLIVMGFGGRRLPLLHVENLVDAYLLVAGNREKTAGKIFNVVDNELPSQREYLDLYREVAADPLIAMHLPLSLFRMLFWVADAFSSGVLNRRLHLTYRLACVARSPRYSAERVIRDLGWQQRVALEEGMTCVGLGVARGDR